MIILHSKIKRPLFQYHCSTQEKLKPKHVQFRSQNTCAKAFPHHVAVLFQTPEFSTDIIILLSIAVPSLATAFLASSQLKAAAASSSADDHDEAGLPEIEFKVDSYTPSLVASEYIGERVKLRVGPISDLKPRTFVFPSLLPAGHLVVISLPRPLGIVLKWDDRRKCAVVSELIAGGHADQRRKVSSLDAQSAREAVLPGDVLRAVTTTNFVYPTKALLGASPPERHLVVYSADNMKFSDICTAMRKGDVKDGNVTLVLERCDKSDN
ncbi:hypothetical protein CEUSTIGMA_g5027.t1 [Chlamydomonas eustigma]|uniref:Uncharacterized protein n=1 Tax=Chlamydomonas eustigma TaxID=1157962 RepID=A0A250X3C8_9CHLO|nr:hypothetical protein CEUSTIGMA_g5027.t1 [Chlamydomonas eustigma]|eukprot:GAX77583.1 hypothetical protein CEUSTIGMA_g5027.t1 [Chlamydomonas eustigma]